MKTITMTVLIADGTPDVTGTVIDIAGVSFSRDPMPILYYPGRGGPIQIGTFEAYIFDQKVSATMKFDPWLEDYGDYFPCLSGTTMSVVGNFIPSIKITHMELSPTNADPRIERLGSRSIRACEHEWVPMIYSRFCKRCNVQDKP